MSKVTFEEDELAVVALFQENTRKDTIFSLRYKIHNCNNP